jgi:hypothetical protein
MIETQELPADFKMVFLKYRTKKVQIVLLGGKGKVGKSTSAQYISEKIESSNTGIVASISPLASPIKLVAYDFFGWDGRKNERGRTLLQQIGDVGRAYDVDMFVKKLEEKELSLFPSNFVLIDDWRYPNEKSYFENNLLYEVTSIRIERNIELEGETSKHISENSLPISEVENLVYNKDSYYNFEVHNYGTLDELYKKLDGIVSYLTTKIISY